MATWQNHVVRFGIQFILAMTGFMIRTRKGNLLWSEVNGLFIQRGVLAMLAAESG